MKITVLAFIFLMFFSYCMAENKVYYDAVKNHEVIDVSGIKTITQINKEFNGNFTDITADKIAQRETNKLVENENLKQKEVERQVKEKAIKTKLNLTDEDFNNLKDALK